MVSMKNRKDSWDSECRGGEVCSLLDEVEDSGRGRPDLEGFHRPFGNLTEACVPSPLNLSTACTSECSVNFRAPVAGVNWMYPI